MEPKPSPFFVLAQRRVNAEKLAEFLQIDDELMRDAAQAEGLQSIYVIQSLEAPNFVSHFEIWDSQAAHDAYVMAETHADFEQKISGLVETVLNPRHYKLFQEYHSGDRPFPKQPSTERIAPVSLEEVDKSVKQTIDALPPLEFFKIVAHAEAAFQPFMQLADALLNRSQLHPRLREMAILAIAHLEQCDYERIQHETLAKQAGITAEQIQAIARGDFTAPILNHKERLVLKFIKAWWQDGMVNDELFQTVAEHFPTRDLVELLIIAGFYLTAARLMNNAGLQPEQPPEQQLNLT